MAAQRQLNRLCASVFDKASSYASAIWVIAGERIEFTNAAGLSAALSDACDRAYHSAPIVHNELVNRRSLSSAATAARRSLLERMLARGGEARLGIEGFPPELSMYRSVLEASGLHHPAPGGWEFGPAGQGDPGRILPLWQGIDRLLSDTETKGLIVAELFARLRQPPFGILDGLLPIYLATALLAWESEIALYEEGSFVPRPDIASFERLIKSPEQFSIQRYRLGEGGREALRRYAELMTGSGMNGDAPGLVAAVRPIVLFGRRLPTYTRLAGSLSPAAKAIRGALLSARDPFRLLFEDLPRALGVDGSALRNDRSAADAFFARLRQALLELQGAYDALLKDIERQIKEALRLPDSLPTARNEVTQRALVLRERAVDLRLRALITRLVDVQLAEREWLESVGACVANKPPKEWGDRDLIQFRNGLAEVAGQFRRLEETILGETTGGKGAQLAAHENRVMRLSVTLGTGEEQREVIHIAPSEIEEWLAAVAAMAEALSRLAPSRRIRAAAVAELAKRVLSETAENVEERAIE